MSDNVRTLLLFCLGGLVGCWAITPMNMLREHRKRGDERPLNWRGLIWPTLYFNWLGRRRGRLS